MSSDGEVKVRVERQGRTRQEYAEFHLPEGNRRQREALIREGAYSEVNFRKITLASTLEIGCKDTALAQVGGNEARVRKVERRTSLITNFKREN